MAADLYWIKAKGVRGIKLRPLLAVIVRGMFSGIPLTDDQIRKRWTQDQFWVGFHNLDFKRGSCPCLVLCSALRAIATTDWPLPV